MASTYAIKLLEKAPSAKVISTVRKATGLPLSEIKSRAIEGRYILECDCSDDEGLRNIIDLFISLGGLNAPAELFWHDNPESIEVFVNILASHEDTAKELGLIEE